MSGKSNIIYNATVMFWDYIVSISGPDDEAVVFSPACPKCGKIVSPDEGVLSNILNEIDGTKWESYRTRELNATCDKCGRVKMLFWLGASSAKPMVRKEADIRAIAKEEDEIESCDS